MSRLAYTQRILEIVGNIRKQKEEITKVHHCSCGRLGQMHVAWPHGDFTFSERQSYLATPQHRTLLPRLLQPRLMQWRSDIWV